MLILALILSIMTSIGWSVPYIISGLCGWMVTPKFLSGVNKNGAPTRSMWTGLILNVFLLTLSDYTFVLVISNVNYLLFNFLNLNSGWIHRLDRPNWFRPFKVMRFLPSNILWDFWTWKPFWDSIIFVILIICYSLSFIDGILLNLGE